MCLLVIIFPKL